MYDPTHTLPPTPNTTTQKIVAISGKMGTGKDSFADLLEAAIRSRGNTVLRIAFADKLKECTAAVQSILGKPVEKDRDFLQGLGDFLNDFYGLGVFVDPVAEAITRSSADYILITDLRRPCEYEFVRKIGAVLVRIEGMQRRDRTEKQAIHSTETALDDEEFDHTVFNHHDLHDLERAAELFLESVGAGAPLRA